jgi:hypothetical protein
MPFILWGLKFLDSVTFSLFSGDKIALLNISIFEPNVFYPKVLPINVSEFYNFVSLFFDDSQSISLLL